MNDSSVDFYFGLFVKQFRLQSSERRFFEFEKIRISENFGFRARYQSVEFRQTFVKMHVGSNTSAVMQQAGRAEVQYTALCTVWRSNTIMATQSLSLPTSR